MADREHSPANTDGSATEPTAGDEFDAAVAEASADPDTPPSEEVGSVGQDGEDDKGSPVDDSAPADDAQGEPAPGEKSASAPDAAPDAKQGDPPAQQTTDDIWAKAPSELREAHEKALKKLEAQARTWEGRTNAARTELRELTRGKPKQEKQDGQAQDGDGEAAKGSLSAETIKQLREDYPELAGPVLDRLEELQSKIDKLDEGVGAIDQERTQSVLDRQEDYLTQQHPDWVDAAKDEGFSGWLEQQPRVIKEAFERNRSAIVDGEDAAFVIGKFKADTGFGKTAPPAQQDDPQQGGDPKDDPEPKANDTRRKRQLESGRDAGRGGAPVTSGIPDDLDAAIEHYAAKA
jgi:hypothetical protein